MNENDELLEEGSESEEQYQDESYLLRYKTKGNWYVNKSYTTISLDSVILQNEMEFCSLAGSKRADVIPLDHIDSFYVEYSYRDSFLDKYQYSTYCLPCLLFWGLFKTIIAISSDNKYAYLRIHTDGSEATIHPIPFKKTAEISQKVKKAIDLKNSE